MNPLVKYTLARLGLFVAVAALLLLLPIPISLLLRLAIALIASALLALYLLRGARDEVAGYLAEAAGRRAEQRRRLRSALAGEDDADQPGNGAGGDGNGNGAGGDGDGTGTGGDAGSGERMAGGR